MVMGFHKGGRTWVQSQDLSDPSDIKRESKYSGTTKAHAWKPRFINSGGATPEFEDYGPGVYKLKWFTD